jgi:hypothetical protein
MSADAQRFFLLLDPGVSPSDDLTRAFLWLKRSIEAAGASGVLVVPDMTYLRTTLAAALGKQLTDLFEEEGRLSLGDGVVMHCQEASRFVAPPRAPLVMIQPDALDLDGLEAWEGPILAVGEASRALRSWIAEAGAEPL